ncbi:DUF4435 domain-containing protein [Tumebacillus permanentifrigoris]|uniref:Uncharacterized protein DUF4435 n=1 Tax=Tumebacillus permanentifrigoris TaxID=378543 RepID=A0A316E0N3_9BACL|nr:DUF4435 domain-containing protein [Tumebacillus permanentifrigoris]PWK16370.1 uncharacterized protein DUF4435 [Tumebacillus permanentifrigoris]
MSGWTDRLQEIREKEIANKNIRVLLVEGTDDKAAYLNLLTKQFGNNWSTKWAIAHANGKGPLLKMLREESSWVGIVDHDEWNSIDIQHARDTHSNLCVLPRYCMESYLIDPSEIWNALTTENRQTITNQIGGYNAFEKLLILDLKQWVRHGVLWSEIQPLRSGLKSLLYQKEILEFEHAQDDVYIQNKLQEWHQYLDPQTIFARLEAKWRFADTQLSQQEQLHKVVHGKWFWKRHVLQVLQRLLGQEDEEEYRKHLWSRLNVPTDWSDILSKLAP